MTHDNGGLEYQAILKTLELYFDGLYFGDTAKLLTVFHEQAHYVCASDGTLIYLSMDEYMPIVANRPSPAARGEKRLDRILSIECAGPVTAFARLECRIGEKFCTDLLSLIKIDSRWQVISKVFHYEIQGAN